jgi:F-type H+-transporting ATPase subunit a
MLDWILLIASVIITAAGLLWRKSIVAKMKADTTPSKKRKSARSRATMITVIGMYLFATRLLTLILGIPPKEELAVSMWAPRVDVFGLNLSTTIIYTWYIMAFLIVVALILRFTVIRHLKDQPGTAQNIIELAVEAVKNYTHNTAHGLVDGLGAYIFTIAAFLVSCAGLELFGLRTPAADITLTFSLALITFVLINVYGIRRKGVKGRLKSFAHPSPVILPIKIVTDLAVPVSMAFRLFGNILGGMIVMDLLYTSLGNNAVGIPSVLGLYFNVFHPLIQAFIFVTLTLTFINEAIE